MVFEYPTHCVFCGEAVSKRQLVGGAWDAFISSGSIAVHLCEHPIDRLARQRAATSSVGAAADGGVHLPLVFNTKKRDSYVHKTHQGNRPAALALSDRPRTLPSLHSPTGYPPLGETAEPGITTAHSERPRVPDAGICSICGTPIVYASRQDMCASCLQADG